ncbi:hypothetical protein MTO96_022173 [Rhipicephalus appendiculatus]
MNHPRNFNYMNSEMAYPHAFHDYTRRGLRDSPIQGMPNEFDVGSTVELAPPSARGVAVHGNLSSMAWAPSPAMASAMPLADGYYEHGRPMKETWATSVYKGLRTMGTDGVAAVVSTLALCFFIGLAIWLLPMVHDQWEGNGLDAADNADAGLHLEARGAPPSSPVAEVHKKMPKIDWKITVGTRRPRSSKRPPITTVELPDVAKTSPAIRSNEDNAESHGSTVDGGDDNSDESKAPWTSAIEDGAVTAASERVHIRRGLPYKEHRWTRRSSAKRVKRRQRVRQRAAPRRDYVEDEKPTEVRGP